MQIVTIIFLNGSNGFSSGSVQSKRLIHFFFIFSLFFLLSSKQAQSQRISNTRLKRERFILNLEDGYFGCQVNESTEYLQIFELSKLCDGHADCYRSSDELADELKCTSKLITEQFSLAQLFFFLFISFEVFLYLQIVWLICLCFSETQQAIVQMMEKHVRMVRVQIHYVIVTTVMVAVIVKFQVSFFFLLFPVTFFLRCCLFVILAKKKVQRIFYCFF